MARSLSSSYPELSAAVAIVMGEQPEQDRIRLILLDDHVLFRASLARFLGSVPGFEVVGESGTSAEALKALNGSSADLVLLDFDLL